MAALSLKLASALALATGAISLGTQAAIAAPPPRVVHSIDWYRWQATGRTLAARASFGSNVVVGLASMKVLEAVRTRYGIRVIATFPQLHAAEVTVTRSLLARAGRDRRIRYVSSLGARRRLLAMPNDPMVSTVDPLTTLPYEWQFAAAHVDRALDYTQGNPAVLVGTIDSGAAGVPDLAGKVAQRWTVSAKGKLAREPRPFDVVGHGTAVASLIAANVDDGVGMAGFGGASRLIVMHAWSLTDVATAAALMKLDALGVRIVNMSFGGPRPETPIMLDAIHKAAADGMLLVAAAGNSAQAVSHPAADLQPPGGARSYGLAVGASDVHGNLAFFSNYGMNLSLLAPGSYDGPCTGVLTAVVPGSTAFDGSCYPTWDQGGTMYGYVAGTSFAAPEVAGIAALIWAVRPQLENYQVAEIIKQSAQRNGGWTPATGCGVLDAGAALALATSLSAGEWATTEAAPTGCSATDER